MTAILDDIAFHWAGAYVAAAYLTPGGEVWTAVRTDNGRSLTGDGGGDLLRQIRADYADWPVPRRRDAPGAQLRALREEFGPRGWAVTETDRGVVAARGGRRLGPLRARTMWAMLDNCRFEDAKARARASRDAGRRASGRAV